MTAGPLYAADEIAARVEAVAAAIASAHERPDIATPVLTGAFIFAADLLRALYRHGLDLVVEPIWLGSYGAARSGTEVTVRCTPGPVVRGRHVLLIDGVLDSGRTLMVARRLLHEAGARRISTAVVVDKRLPGAPLVADHACFSDCSAFISGYGMDDGGLGRGRPDINTV